jgi:hypothetical protein
MRRRLKVLLLWSMGSWRGCSENGGIAEYAAEVETVLSLDAASHRDVLKNIVITIPLKVTTK